MVSPRWMGPRGREGDRTLRRMGWSALLVGLTRIWLGAPVARAVVRGDRTDLLDVEGKLLQAHQVDAPLRRHDAQITVAPAGPIAAGGTIDGTVILPDTDAGCKARVGVPGSGSTMAKSSCRVERRKKA